MGDQIAGQQLVAGLEQGRQGHPQQGGQRAVAVERQPVLVGHGRQEEVQQHGLSREMVHVLAHEATVRPGPACVGRTTQSRGNQNAFSDHGWAPESVVRLPTVKSASRGHAIIDDRRTLGGIVTPEGIATVLAQGCGVAARTGAAARLGTRWPASSGHPRCRESATYVHDPGHCEPPDGRRGNSSVPGCGGEITGGS